MSDDVFSLGTLKIVADITKTLLPLVREAKSKGLDAQYADELNSKIAEMQAAVLDAQNDALASQQVQSKQSTKIRELEQAIAEFEGWESEMRRYKLVNVGRYAEFVYLLRQEAAQKDRRGCITSVHVATITGSIIQSHDSLGYLGNCVQNAVPTFRLIMKLLALMCVQLTHTSLVERIHYAASCGYFAMQFPNSALDNFITNVKKKICHTTSFAPRGRFLPPCTEGSAHHLAARRRTA